MLQTNNARITLPLSHLSRPFYSPLFGFQQANAVPPKQFTLWRAQTMPKGGVCATDICLPESCGLESLKARN